MKDWMILTSEETASDAPRPSCPKCVLKHLSQACVLFQESLQGYPSHRWLAIGHMAEAEAEAQGIASEFADKLREERKKSESVDDLGSGYVPDCMGLIKDFAGVSPEAKVAFESGDCPSCERLKSKLALREGVLKLEERVAGEFERSRSAGIKNLITKARAKGAQMIAKAVMSSPAVRAAVGKVAVEAEEKVGKESGPDVILRASSANRARDAIKDAVAEGVVNASAKAVGGSPSRFKRMAKAFVKKALPMLPFGFIDNFLMIMAGDVIDSTLAATLGIGTMAAAGIGNAGSDAVGALSQGRVESLLSKVGLGGELEGGKAEAIAGAAGGAFGVAVGALIGMFPLAFMGSEQTQEQDMDSKDVGVRVARNFLADEEDAYKLIMSSDGPVQMVEDAAYLVAKSFTKARKDLKGLDRFGSGVIEAPVFLKSLLRTVKSLEDLTSYMRKQMEKAL